MLYMDQVNPKYTFTIPQSAFTAAIPRLRDVITAVTTSEINTQVARLLDDALSEARRDGRFVEFVDTMLDDHTAQRYAATMQFGALQLVGVVGVETRRYYREFSGSSGYILLTVLNLAQARDSIESGEWRSVDGTLVVQDAGALEEEEVVASDAQRCPNCDQPRLPADFLSGGRPRADGTPAVSLTCKRCRVEASVSGRAAVKPRRVSGSRRGTKPIGKDVQIPLLKRIAEERAARVRLRDLRAQVDSARSALTTREQEMATLDQAIVQIADAISRELEQLRAI